eukprot:7779684-Pyramimonas_sp.AAC.1
MMKKEGARLPGSQGTAVCVLESASQLLAPGRHAQQLRQGVHSRMRPVAAIVARRGTPSFWD